MEREETRLEHRKAQRDGWMAVTRYARLHTPLDESLVDEALRHDRHDATERAERWRRKYGEGERGS